jgi:hypothetical protein
MGSPPVYPGIVLSQDPVPSGENATVLVPLMGVPCQNLVLECSDRGVGGQAEGYSDWASYSQIVPAVRESETELKRHSDWVASPAISPVGNAIVSGIQ